MCDFSMTIGSAFVCVPHWIPFLSNNAIILLTCVLFFSLSLYIPNFNIFVIVRMLIFPIPILVAATATSRHPVSSATSSFVNVACTGWIFSLNVLLLKATFCHIVRYFPHSELHSLTSSLSLVAFFLPLRGVILVSFKVGFDLYCVINRYLSSLITYSPCPEPSTASWSYAPWAFTMLTIFLFIYIIVS